MDRRAFISSSTAFAATPLAVRLANSAISDAGGAAPLKKIKDVVIYQDERFYSAFPSLVTRPDGEILCAFRRAPDRRRLGEGGNSHTDPNSYLVLVRSLDGGATWSREPELIFAHPFGGSQDPCMVQLRDGTILCASYGWSRLTPEAAAKTVDTSRVGDFVFMGGYIMRSSDGGKSWQGPILPPPTPGSPTRDLFGKPCPSYNRGAMCEGKNGKLYWAVAAEMDPKPRKTSVDLLISSDGGTTWSYSCPIAKDAKAGFNETSLYETEKGDVIAFIRSESFNDHTVVARSRDGGKSFEPWQDAGWQGHPHHALGLRDGRVLLIYGYRHAPFGVRARVLDAECTNFASAPEFVIRDDGDNGDLGYPWLAPLPDGGVLAAYYFNQKDGTRQIAGSVLAVV